MNKMNKKSIILLILVLLALALLSVISTTAQECETTVIYWGLCSPSGDISARDGSGNLLAQEVYGTFRGCYAGFYSIVLGTGGSGCDLQQGELVNFYINGVSAGSENWNGDYTRRLNLATGSVVSCTTNNDCSYPTDVCVSGTCQPCSSSAQCNTGDQCLAGVCRPPVPPTLCVDNGDCSYPNEICSAGVCEPCMSTSECNTGDLCTSGVCLPPGGCVNNNDCVYPQQVCISGNCSACTADNQCNSGQVCTGGVCLPPGSCVDNNDCSYPNGVCISGQCNACTNSSQCSSGDLCLSGVCEPPCTDNNDCLYPFEICQANGTCGTCTTSSDCDPGEICGAGVCGPPCTTNNNCSYPADVCINGSCQPCVDNNDCNLGNVCSNGMCGLPCTTNNNCSYPNQVCSNGICQPCSTNSECNSGQVCSNNVCVTPINPPPGGGGTTRGGGGGSAGRSGGRPPVGGSNNICNICGPWGQCTVDGLQDRQCTAIDCGTLASVIIPTTPLSVLPNSRSLLTRDDGRVFRTVLRGATNITMYYTLTLSNFTNPTEYYEVIANANSYRVESKQCNYVASCNDGIRNNGEDGIDCGGSCIMCAAEASCNDGVQNQGETGIDCGGNCVLCEEQSPLTHTSTKCWLWWIPLLLLLIFLTYLVYDHRANDRELSWPIVALVIVLIAVNIVLLWLCYNTGAFYLWLVLLFLLVLLALFVGYEIYERKHKKIDTVSSLPPKSPGTRPVSLKLSPKPIAVSNVVSGLSPSAKIENVRNLIADANDKLVDGKVSEVREITRKIASLYATLPKSSEKEALYKEFMKLYDAISSRLNK